MTEREPCIPAPASPSATVILLRPTPLAVHPMLETFLLKRPAAAAFGGAHVFPGGRVDSLDADPRWSERCHGLEIVRARLGSHLPADAARAHIIAAVREVFEETGILLGSGHDELTDSALETARHALLQERHAFLEWCTSNEVVLDARALRPWAHWITPEGERRRFDTWFFVAPVASGLKATVWKEEAVEGAWWPIDAALRAAEQGAMTLAPPTLRTLEELARVHSPDQLDLCSAARRLHPILPKLLREQPKTTFVLPGDPEYPDASVPRSTSPSRFVLDGDRWVSVTIDV